MGMFNEGLREIIEEKSAKITELERQNKIMQEALEDLSVIGNPADMPEATDRELLFKANETAQKALDKCWKG